MLTPLGNFGGTTPTHAFQSLGSPAIDKGKSFGSNTDQRGRTRSIDFSNISNATARSRTNGENMGVSGLFGLQGKLVPSGTDPGAMVDASSTSSSNGAGSVKRSEALTTNVGAVITQILPNGNMVIQVTQEVRTNAELRQLTVACIVRPLNGLFPVRSS